MQVIQPREKARDEEIDYMAKGIDTEGVNDLPHQVFHDGIGYVHSFSVSQHADLPLFSIYSTKLMEVRTHLTTPYMFTWPLHLEHICTWSRLGQMHPN